MPVFSLSPECIAPPTLSITGDLLIHLRDSLRVTVGDTLWFSDGHGARYRAEITDLSKQTLVGRILETVHEPDCHTPRLILGQSLLKGDKMDWVIQKVIELGVAELIPIQSRHSIVQLKADRIDSQMARWSRIALEAAQQSEQWHLPTIAPPQSLKSLLTNLSVHPHRVALLLTERRNGQSVQAVTLPHESTDSILVLIGPEGGWSQEEVALADQAGLVPVTLGSQILRAETAAIATVSILQSRLGNLG